MDSQTASNLLQTAKDRCRTESSMHHKPMLRVILLKRVPASSGQFREALKNKPG